MGRISDKYKYETRPMCNENAVVKGSDYRFTVLTNCLIRMEYDPNRIFEDRATQTVINRDFDVPMFRVTENDDCIKIVTDSFELTYTGGPFSKNSLSVMFRGATGATRGAWYFGDENNGSLRGTARTLDGVNGECTLEDGIIARWSAAILDDSKSLVIAEDGWVEARAEGTVDVYLFAHQTHFKEALRDYYRLTGKSPMIPRYALGNWWSRYYKYSQEEYKALMLEFKKRGIPYSVAVLDMDWHIVDVDPHNGTGWTGFTWNKELFPNHKELLKFLHEQGMEVTLNLHPAEGIAKHEDCYRKVAERMSVDAEKGESVSFDITNPKFIEAYFEDVLNPMEEEGVSFWWMDWQQGNTTKIPGLDPLWMLNHYHYLDMRSRGIRPMILSRYAGPGSHRYPIGFSGDTHITWESLDFQPYFTVNASNIGYCWWSHDIGGHMCGYRDDELMARWTQFGVFSPIMRLHSANNDFQSKEPWLYGKETEQTMIRYMRLRHKLIPYLYTMNYCAYHEDMPLMRPLYYMNPSEPPAYTVNRNEYYFGSEMIVSPITKKSDAVTNMGDTKTYLPDGRWFDIFSNHSYTGGNAFKMYRPISHIPVLAKAGAIIPMAEPLEINDIQNPKKLTVLIFPGADNSFELYEDDGVSMEYLKGIYATTAFKLKWGDCPMFFIGAPNGNEKIIQKNRSYMLEFRKIADNNRICVTEDGMEIPFEMVYQDECLYIKLENINGNIEVRFIDTVSILENNFKKEVFEILLKSNCENTTKKAVYDALRRANTAAEFGLNLSLIELDCNLRDAVLEMVMSSENAF